jgi:hypothetical protein
MIVKLVYLSIMVAAIALVFGFALGTVWTGASAVAVVGTLWVLGYRRGLGWASTAGLALYVVAAAVGIWLDMGAGWMLAGLLAALAAWDLAFFAQRLRAVERVVGWEEMQRRHLLRLLVVEGAGLLLATAALLLRLQLGFVWLILLGILALVGLTRSIGPFRRESE